MATRRGRSSRGRTFWEAVTFSGTASTIAETFPVTTEALMNDWGPVTLLRMKVLGFAQGVLTAESATAFAIVFRKVYLDRASDVPTDIGGSVMDATYAASEEILHFGVHYLSPGAMQRRSDDLVIFSTRPGVAINTDVKAKRRFDDASQRLVIDVEALGVGTSDVINLQLTMRLLLLSH